MTRIQYSQKEDEVNLRKIFDNDSILVVYQGTTINFSHPLNKHITEDQLIQARKINYIFVSCCAVINQSGMSDHLHIWLKKLADWEIRENIKSEVDKL